MEVADFVIGLLGYIAVFTLLGFFGYWSIRETKAHIAKMNAIAAFYTVLSCAVLEGSSEENAEG